MIYFVLFAAVLVGTYVSLRRELAPPRLIAGVSILGSSISLTLFSAISRDLHFVVAFVVGIIAGSVFSGLTLALAWYFHKQELQSR